MLRHYFSFQLDWSPYIFYIAKTVSKKIGASIRFMKLLSPVVVLSSYKSTVNTCMKYNCYACTGAPSCCLDMLDKLYKWVCRTVGTILLPLWDPYSMGKTQIAYVFPIGIILVDVPQNYLNWFLFFTLVGSPLAILIDIMNFLSSYIYVNSFIPCTDRILNFLPAEYFPLTYDMNGLNSRVIRYFLSLDFLKTVFLVCF